jgi:hypothetical protein
MLSCVVLLLIWVVLLCCAFVDLSCVSCCFGLVLCFYCICVVLFVWDIQMVSCRIVVLVCWVQIICSCVDLVLTLGWPCVKLVLYVLCVCCVEQNTNNNWTCGRWELLGCPDNALGSVRSDHPFVDLILLVVLCCDMFLFVLCCVVVRLFCVVLSCVVLYCVVFSCALLNLNGVTPCRTVVLLCCCIEYNLQLQLRWPCVESLCCASCVDLMDLVLSLCWACAECIVCVLCSVVMCAIAIAVTLCRELMLRSLCWPHGPCAELVLSLRWMYCVCAV